MMFGGFGPIIAGIVYVFVSYSVEGFSLGGWQVFIAILSTYFLAFLQAGASVFNQIEEWKLSKSLTCHFVMLYLAYTLCYLVNTWIPFYANVLLIFTLIFVAVYAVVWMSVYLIIKAVSKKLNEKLN